MAQNTILCVRVKVALTASRGIIELTFRDYAQLENTLRIFRTFLAETFECVSNPRMHNRIL